ncbi:hypothetical protein [Gordonia sp. 'Campus']|uniref:hypothetical protein n=1 Tax=Gordonia sp. 'Campus' TaxID=2915824 RepID=UPI001EE3E210|nr:hypothetical protein [Gordonia sp. 'Campus']
MSLEFLESQISDIRSKAEQVRNQYERETQAINNDTSLSDSGKRERVSAYHDAAKAKMQKLRQNEVKLVEDRKQQLSQDLFGLSSTTSSDPNQIIAYRDAQDRASKIESGEEAQRLLDSATLSGDKSLTSAILARAFNEGWSKIIDKHAADNPQSLSKMRDLKKLQEYNTFASAGFTYMVSSLR